MGIGNMPIGIYDVTHRPQRIAQVVFHAGTVRLRDPFIPVQVDICAITQCLGETVQALREAMLSLARKDEIGMQSFYGTGLGEVLREDRRRA